MYLFIFSISSYSFSQLAFPEAEGFGKHATGGRGGAVIKVTNLNNSGAGSLRQALQYTSGARTIVFEVGGTITLTSALSVTNGNVTVAGQTAPGGGILIKGSMVIIEDSNVIMRYIKFRPGPSAPANEPDGLSITAWGSDIVENIIIDHCSISWARDENFDIRAVSSGKVQNVTIQNSIISESGYGSLAGHNTYNKTYYKNLFAHNQDRNITTNYPTDGDFFDFEMINNLVYGCGSGPGLAWGSKHTILNNHFRESSQESIYNIICDYGSGGAGTLSETYAYISGNIIPAGKTESASVIAPYLQSTPYASSGIVPMEANLVAGDILSHVGASLPNRDAVDIRLINQYNNGNGALARSGVYPQIANGTAPVDTDDDGMPDSWEIENGLNITNASDRNIVQADGYTNLEYYLNGISLQTSGVTANAGADVETCEGESVTLTASGGTSYLWNTGATTQSINVSPNTTTTYTVTAYNSSGTDSDTDAVEVTVNSIPTANAGQDVETCEGTSVTLTASGGTSYLWNTGATTQSIEVTPNTTTTYSVEVTENNCSSTDTVEVVVNALPNVNAGLDVIIFEGESTQLTASGADSYLWNTGEITQSIEVTPNTTTTYSVTGTTNNCSSTDTVVVTVETDTVIANAGADVETCEGESVTLTASGGTSYLWNTGATTQSINVSPNTTTTYTVTAYNSSGTDSDTDAVEVTVNSIPTANAGQDVETCEGTSVTLTASGGTSYLWNTGATTQSIEVTPNTTTTYSVEVTENNCSSTDTVEVVVNALPNVNAGLDVTIFEGESTQLTASGADSYLWNTGATTQSIEVTPNTTTTYSVTGTTNNCSSTDTVVVTVETDTVIANAGDDETICHGYEVILTATGGDSYLWSTGATTQSITVNPTITTNYTVTVFEGNNQDTDDVTVYVNPNPNVAIVNGDNVTILEGEFITLSATGANSYQWSNGATQPNIAVSPGATTSYSVTGYINNCFDEKTVTVNVLETVEANAGSDITICNTETTVLTASGGESYLWSTGETTQSIEVAPDEDTEYSVLVYNELDADEDDVMVYVTDCSVDLPEEADEFGFLVYQDAIADVLKVKISGFQNANVNGVSIYDISGKFLLRETFNNVQESTVVREINTSSFSRGIYIIQLQYDNKSIVKKVPIR
ncbi:T9SS type A sorting domain-containing protein [Ichthyenterobacterium magnum]|uniref:Putative secreted protein (Por secretion system target) n=1 Tax=Ichthyenterobacterium magnum TaxID=1230530 RepID=A0A420DM92_9FLAO|nr:T9SS type A sorting domain-containing protein [Ichthyenterobacterium magnum]RKE95315.1 putative secreted protein (Por secretion system target) [Ichthyenterobacterium magnum]